MKERQKDLVGKEVRLVHRIETRGGTKFRKGTRMRVYGAWRGKFHLQSVSRPKRSIRHVDRYSFEIDGGTP